MFDKDIKLPNLKLKLKTRQLIYNHAIDKGKICPR